MDVVSWSDAERSVRVDWLSFTTRRSLPSVLMLFDGLDYPLEPKEKGLHGYTHSFVSASGVTVLYSVGRPDIHVQITGEGCTALGGWFKLLSIPDAARDKVTRLDVAVDCLGSGVTCDDVWRLLCQGCYISGSSNIRHFEGLPTVSGVAASSGGVLPRKAHTIYVGSTQSQRMVRIYDKGAESGTNTDWLRVEVQLRAESANTAFQLMLASRADWVNIALGIVSKCIKLTSDPFDRENNNHSRAVVHPFWAFLTDSVAPLSLRIPQRVKEVTNTLRYLKHTASAFKAVRSAIADWPEIYESVVQDAVLKDKHLKVIRELTKPLDFSDLASEYESVNCPDFNSLELVGVL